MARWPVQGRILEARGVGVLRREQQVRSLGLFADAGGISHRTLKELEKKASRSPSDANAEVSLALCIYMTKYHIRSIVC